LSVAHLFHGSNAYHVFAIAKTWQILLRFKNRGLRTCQNSKMKGEGSLHEHSLRKLEQGIPILDAEKCSPPALAEQRCAQDGLNAAVLRKMAVLVVKL
jgi:hypothetical protein